MYGGRSSPECAKIWSFILSLGEHYEDYANNIDDICAKDSLTDTDGLTVIIPDKSFMKEFEKNIHGSGSASVARRILMNTVCRKYLPSTSTFEEYSSNIPFRSGLTLKVSNIDKLKNEVTFSNNVTIKVRKDFKVPCGFRYAVWEVVRGQYPIEVSFVSRKGDKKEKKGIRGGGNYIVNVGNALKNSLDAQKIGMLATILAEYKTSILYPNKCDVKHPLLIKCVSLYNWIKMYKPELMKEILITMDINPGISLLILLLDPNSVITEEILLGTGDRNDGIEIATGWRNSIITQNPLKEWKLYLEQASRWCDNNHTQYFKNLLGIRNTFIKQQKINIEVLSREIKKVYSNVNEYVGKYITPEYKDIFNKRYSKTYPYRKLWEDQLRYVGTSIFTNNDTMTIVSTKQELIDSLQNAVSFRPMLDMSYDRAATFTFEGGSYMSQEDYGLTCKWFFSTAFMYMTDGNVLVERNNKPYNGTLDSAPKTDSIVNIHNINYKMLIKVKEEEYIDPNVLYSMQWRRKNDNAKLKQVIDGMTMGGEETGDEKIGGDPYIIGGNRLLARKKNKKRANIVQRSSCDSGDDSYDELRDIAYITMLTGNNHTLEDEENDNLCKGGDRVQFDHL
uniref:Uncharacterized protein n=1 Tax=viral metagenome TaxID=1070528 RepID=A0A6C0LKD5_9ZZZZ